MGILDKFEKGVENVTSRAMSRFSDDVEPIEIASKVRETMDKRAASFARDRSVVPNVFRIHLAPSDVSRIESWGLDEMIRQMEEVATTHASEQGYSFVGPVKVSFAPDADLTAPAIEIESSTRRGGAAPAASASAETDRSSSTSRRSSRSRDPLPRTLKSRAVPAKVFSSITGPSSHMYKYFAI